MAKIARGVVSLPMPRASCGLSPYFMMPTDCILARLRRRIRSHLRGGGQRSYVMFERIFVLLNGTEHAERALPAAARIARATGGTLILVNIVLPPLEDGTYLVNQTVEMHPAEHEARIERAFLYLDELLDRYGPDLRGIKTEKTVTSEPYS